MNNKLLLDGVWHFRLDTEKQGLTEHFEKQSFSDSILLPGTVSLAQKGSKSSVRHTGYLTDPYSMEGYAWYQKQIDLPFQSLDEMKGLFFSLHLERTRISHVFIDGVKAGSLDSFVASHDYNVTSLIHTLHPVITIMVANTDYKVPGGHLTSPDTQTNWNGILGEISLSWNQGITLSSVFPTAMLSQNAVALSVSVANQTSSVRPGFLRISARHCRLKDCYRKPDTDIRSILPKTTSATFTAESVLFDLLCDTEPELSEKTFPLSLSHDSADTFLYELDRDGKKVFFWSEYEPDLYLLSAFLLDEDGSLLDEKKIIYGHKEFLAEGSHFTINGHRTLLRGKHEGMIFPLTGFAPMCVEDWLYVMKTARDFGINHYRFHTCCPPKAAFIAADLLGIYMEPEIPFWGTFSGPDDDGYDEVAQTFLEEEGFRMLSSFSAHPSFCMMSMGNELWGNPSAINDLLTKYKAFRPNVLYTQGSNNFQWVPNIQPMDDFFCGVRFTLDRQIRGSYAMCDKPLGHVQTMTPNTRFHYENAIFPDYQGHTQELSSDGTVEIQYGTGVKRVKLTEACKELIPSIPVVSHEIGQYCTFPDFSEIDSYSGVLKAYNFAIFKERLSEKGLLAYANDFFLNSGALAVSCYKNELETAFRTPSLAGFQILDIQDFSGQGTALVGVLNAFMENKGLISSKDFRSFCNEAVLQAEFDSFVIDSNCDFSFTATLAYYGKNPLVTPVLAVRLCDAYSKEELAYMEHTLADINSSGRHILGNYTLALPANKLAQKLSLNVSIKGCDITNQYDLWAYDFTSSATTLNALQENSKVAIASSIFALPEQKGVYSNVLLFLPEQENLASIEGTYCTDFWCYPMFNSISISMGKETPIGTLGLLIDKQHEALSLFPTESYSTPQWHSIVMASRSTILDDTDIAPIVMTIDNFERNHRLGLIYEVYLKDLELSVLVCTSDLPRLIEEGKAEATLLYQSLIHYVASMPKAPYETNFDDFQKLVMTSKD